HHRRGLEAMALEPQDQPQPVIVQGNAATTPLRRHHRRNGIAGASDAQTDSTDASASDTTAANNGDPSNLNNDPNVTAGMNGVGGSAPGSPILPPDAPSNIMKAIQHGNGPGGSPSPSARNNGNNSF